MSDEETTGERSPHGSHTTDREHGHGYEHQKPEDWLPRAELDGQIFIPAVLSRLTAEIDLEQPARVLDVGCGPGVGTAMLATRFPEAVLYGLDVGEAVLEAAAGRATADGLSDRVRFVRADFDQDLGRLIEPVDLVFASMSLHHTEDPGAALGRVCDLLVPGGRMVLAEFGRPLRIWPDDHHAATSGLWDRWQSASHAARVDHLGEAAVNVNWLELLQQKGLDRIEHFECDIVYQAPLADRERAWLAKGLERGVQGAGGRLDPADQATLEAMYDPDDPSGISRSDEVRLDTSRMIYTGVRR